MHVDDKAPEVQNRGVSGPTRRELAFKKLKKNQRNVNIESVAWYAKV